MKTLDIDGQNVKLTLLPACSMGEMRNTYKVVVRKPKGTRSFGMPRHQWENNNNTYLKKTGYEIVEWIHVVQGGYH
jgi:hypothetical protein